MKNKKKLNINKASLVEATMLAMQGKLILEEEKEIKTEDIEVETDDVEVTLGTDKTIIDSEEATITIEKNSESSAVETEPETIEVPVEGDETIIPEEVVEPEEVEDEVPSIDEIVDEEVPTEEVSTEPEIEDEEVVEPEEVEEVEDEEVPTEESKSLEEDLTSEEFPEDGTYWSGNGKYQEDVDMLNKLIPATGTTPTIPDVLPDKVVEDYINLSNKYYRWFNDGDVPFKKLKDGTTIYPSYTRGNNRQTFLGQKTCNSISFDLENRVNSLIEKINSQYPDWKAKLQPTDTSVDELQESKEVKTEDEKISRIGVHEDVVSNLGDGAIKLADKYNIQMNTILDNVEDIIVENSNLFESKEVEKIEEAISPADQLVAGKLYDFVANNYTSMDLELLKEIALNAIYELNDDAKIIADIKERMVESKESCENCNKENCDCSNKEAKVESINKFNANSFKTVVEGFLKELDETVDSFKLNKVLKNESAIRIYGEVLSQNNSKSICLEGKMIQKGKAFTKYEIAKPSGLKLESKEFTRSSMVTFTNKENILECKYFKQATAKVEE